MRHEKRVAVDAGQVPVVHTSVAEYGPFIMSGVVGNLPLPVCLPKFAAPAARRQPQPAPNQSPMRTTSKRAWHPEAPQDQLLAHPPCAYEGPFDHWRVSRRVNNARSDAANLLLSLNGQGASARCLQDSKV